MLRKRVPDVGSGDRRSSAADGSQSDWRHDRTVSSGRTRLAELSLASANPRLFYLSGTGRLTWAVTNKGPLNGCVCVRVCVWLTG